MSVFKSTSRRSGGASSSSFKATGRKSYDYSVVYDWEIENKNSFDLLNNYYTRISNGEWLSPEDRASYRTALDSYIDSTNRLRGINKTFGKGYTDEEERKWADSVSLMNKEYTDVDNYYSHWIDEKDYKGERSGWFQSSNLFDDGYQFGDVLKTAGGTLTDVAENVGAGVIGLGEAALDGLMTLGPYFAEGQYYSNGGGYNLHADSVFRQSNDAFKGFTSDFVEKDLYDEEEVAKAIITKPVKSWTGIDAEVDSVFGEKMDGLGQSTGQLLGTAALQAVGVPWWLTTGATTLGRESENALNQGASLEQAAFSGLVSAAAEILTEKISGGISFGGNTLDDVITKQIASKISNKTLRTLANLGFNMAGEGAEEVISGYMSAIGQKLTYASDRELNEIFSSEDALDSFIGGAILGFGNGVVGNVGQKISSNIEAKKLYGNGAGLVSEALAINPEDSYAKKMQAKIGKGKSLSGHQLNRIVEANNAAYTSQDTAKIKNAIVDRLTELGETGNISKITEVLFKQARGEALTSADYAVLNQSSAGYTVATEMDADNISGGGLANTWAESIGTKKIGDGIYNKRASVKVNTSDGASTSISKIADINDGRVSVELEDGTQTDASNITFNDEKTELVFKLATERVGRVDGWTTETANAMIKAYEDVPTMTPESFSNGWTEAYDLGRNRGAYSQLSVMPYAEKLPSDVRMTAYNIGYAIGSTNSVKNTNVGSFTFDDSITSEMQRNFTKKQKADVEALKIISKALGVNVELFDSPTNAEGERVGENGSYDPKTRTVRIDLHSGKGGEGLVMFTAAHELSHHMRVTAKSSFNKFADAVFASLDEGGVDVKGLVNARVNSLRKNGRLEGLSESQAYDLAYEEVVADAAERMLADSDAVQRLASELKTKDKTLWQKVKDYISNLVKRIKTAYAKLDPGSYEGRKLKEVAKDYDNLLKIWSDAVVEMSRTEEMVSIDVASESVSPLLLSERTWTASEYVTERNKMAEKIAKALGVSVAKAKKYIDDITSIAKMIANDRARLDYEASSFGSAFVSNVEYGGSFDYTTLCKKRRIYTGTFTEIQKRLKDVALTPDDILKIRNLLIDEGIEATCGLCYVEGSRANMGKFAKKFIELYKRDNPNSWIPNMADVNTPDGVEKMRINHPEVYKSYEYFWNHYGKLKDSDPALFASQQKPKLYEARKEYQGEILKHFKDEKSIDKKNLNGGIRMQSFSDFEIVHLIDTMQVIMDMSTVGLAGQAYTKVPEFAKAFGNTGLKINLSIIAKGVDADGKLIFDDREGMPHDTAFELRNKYSKNVGTIIVTFTDEQLLAAMADPRIDFIIPFHRSQWKKGQYGAMGLPKGTKDYTFMQNEKLIKQTYHEYQGRMVKDKASNYMPNDYWDFSKSGKENAESYLKMCAENNKRPKFYRLLDYDGNGTYSLKADGSTDGYWKLLIDFKMYDNNGVGSPQTQVVPNFNMDEAVKMLDEYKGGHSSYPVAHGVVEQFISEYNKENKTKYSDRDTSYIDAVNRGDMETAQRMVDEAAKEAGYTVKGLHATNAEFTVFDINKTSAENFHGKGIYFTNSVRDVENNYENYEGPDPWQKIEGRAYELAYDKYGISYEDTLTSDSEIIDKLNECYDIAIDEFKKSGRRITAYLRFDNPLILEKGMQIPNDYAGYDGIVDKQVYENIGHSGMDENTIHYVVFNPNNIKSADPVTYDDKGNVIPLSERFNPGNSDIRYSDRVTDQETLDFLENQEHVTVYRAMQVIDGELYPPMAAKVKSSDGKKSLVAPSKIGAWEQAVERPNLIRDGNKFELDKANGSSIKAAYNPYFHTSASPLNDQFSSAYKRTNLVIVEGKIPSSELTSGYRAEYAKDTVGETKWHSGPVASKLKGDKARRVFLSRWFKPVRIVPDSEVASIVAKTLEGENIDVPYNVVTPTLRAELEKAGVSIKYQDRTDGSMDNRSLLANALDSVAQTPMEKQKLAEYKAKIRELNVQSRKLYEINQEIKELTFGKGKKNPERLKALREEATKTTNRINFYDKKLLELQATKPLRDVLERETKKAYKEAAQKGREAYHRNVEGRRKTEARHKIQRIAKELASLLNKGTKDRNVKKGEAPIVRAALDLSDMLFATDDEIIVNGVGVTYTNAEARAMDEYMKLYEEYHSYDNSVTEHKERRAFLRSQMTDLKHSFDGVIERERLRISEVRSDAIFDSLMKEYEKLAGAEESYIRNAFDKDALEHIKSLKERVGNTLVSEMNLGQLDDVYKAFKMIKKMVVESNKLFKSSKKETVQQVGEAAMTEIESFGHKEKFTKIGKVISKLGWNNLKPIYLMERTGSKTMQRLFQGILNGESDWAVDMAEARDFIAKQKENHGYGKWDFKAETEFTSNTGKTFKLKLGQMLSIYAYSKRGEQALEHLRTDGFVYDETVEIKGKSGITYELNDKTAYKISDEVLFKILGSLTAEQKAYADEMIKYLSDTMGAKGNEVSNAMYGIDLFGEENYFPIRSERAYLERAREQAKGEVKIKNKGFTKPTQPGARNAIVLSDFNQLWSEHVAEMSSYHAFTLPLEDFYRVYNYQTTSDTDVDKRGVIPALDNAFGTASTQAIDQLLTDLNGGVRSDPRETAAKTMLSLYKKAKVMASMSVVVQQPSSILRVQALIDPKYFVGKKIDNKRHKALWEEVKKYAPVAIIKEMGHFDVGMGKASADWLLDEKTVWDTIDDVTSKPASFADEITWVSIWNAVKRETASKNPAMNTSSEEFLKKAGERFEDVIRRTQVYDSTLARSANMRSKSLYMQMATAFLAEPTTSINMREMALRSGDKRRIARTTAAVYSATLLNAVLVALPYAMRDDDEDETFAEKYITALATSFADGVNPITALPFLKDVWSIAQGYDVERADMTLVDDFLSSMQKLVKALAEDEIDAEKVIAAIAGLGGDLASLTGIPLDNIIRDIKGLINFGSTITRDIKGMDTTWRSLGDALQKAFHSETPILGWLPGETKGDKLYDALVAGDAKYVARFRATYKDDSTYLSAVRKALRENDPRMREAAEAYINKDFATYNALRDEIVKEGVFDRSLVTEALKAEINYLKGR